MQEVSEAMARDDVGTLLAEGCFVDACFSRNGGLSVKRGSPSSSPSSSSS